MTDALIVISYIICAVAMAVAIYYVIKDED
jgi:uncharacterized protein YoxC